MKVTESDTDSGTDVLLPWECAEDDATSCEFKAGIVDCYIHEHFPSFRHNHANYWMYLFVYMYVYDMRNACVRVSCRRRSRE